MTDVMELARMIQHNVAFPPWTSEEYEGSSDKWGDEQDRSEYFEELANAGSQLAAMVLDGTLVVTEPPRLAAIRQVRDQLNAHPELAVTGVLHQLGFNPDDIHSEDSSAFDLDDPDNDIIDFGFEGNECVLLHRVAKTWQLERLTVT